MSWSHRVFAGCWAAIVLMVAGCARDPAQAPVEAGTARALATWRMKVANRFTLAEWKEFEAALQEIRLRVMAERAASGSEAVEEALCARINGRTMRDVLLMGYEARLSRLRPLRGELKKAVEGNELLVTKPGDRASATYLEDLRARQNERLQKTEAEIKSAEERIIGLGGTVSKNVDAAETEREPEMKLTREKALAEVWRLIHDQRDAAVFKFGGGAVEMDREGAELSGEERAEFFARKKVAATGGRAVIAVRVRGRWWIFDDKAEPPGFSPAVEKMLSDADRREIGELWVALQAEIWARRASFEEVGKDARER